MLCWEHPPAIYTEQAIPIALTYDFLLTMLSTPAGLLGRMFLYSLFHFA
jgi:hypothetical protein